MTGLFDLSGKVAIVTGGATGLGLQFATGLAEAGASIVLCARDGARCARAAEELAGLGVRTLGLACDVRSEADIDAVVDKALAELGRIDVLINNAGTARSGWPQQLELDDWQAVVDVNLTGVFLFCRAVGRAMIEAGRGGKIVNVASVAGLRGAPAALMNSVAYQASKGGVVILTQDLACKWARHGITVNTIAPGWFPTEMTEQHIERRGDALLERIPLGRFGGSDDLKGAVVFLASRASDYVTGQTLAVDGGQTAW